VTELSENVNDKTSGFLCQKSLDTGAIIVAGFIERDGDSFITPHHNPCRDSLGVYRKLHLYYKEKMFFTPGIIL